MTKHKKQIIEDSSLFSSTERVDFSHIADGNEEVPTIFIENDDNVEENAEPNTITIVQQKSRKSAVMIGIIIGIAMMAIAIAGILYYKSHVAIGLPISRTSQENIAILQQTTSKKVKSEVVLTTDTILGVTMNFYELRGLRAEVSLTEPDTLDQSVYLYSRCADHAADGTYLGSLVINGEEYQSDLCRLGYCAMTGNNMVIGIDNTDDVKDFVQEQGGCFFRQFILVCNGVIPNNFYLHGKVERRGLGRINDRYYYIETLNQETLWDFADALREYGFTDAIYITGGNDYSFYRTADGTRHDIGPVENYPHTKWKGIIPWLVFRKI